MDKSTLQIVLTAKDDLSKELKKVQKELGKISNELNKNRKVSKQSTRDIKKDFRQVSEASESTKGKIKKLVGTFAGLGAMRLFGAIGALYALRRAAMFVNQLSIDFTVFEHEMRRVNTITRLNQQEFRGMEKEIVALAAVLPKTSLELATGLFDVASAGISAGNQMAFLGVASKLAVGGFFDVQTAVQGLTAVMKGYGMQESEVTKIADLFFKTNELGQTTVKEVANSIQELTSNAKASGISVEELFNVFATFTGVTGNASRVATQFKGALNALAKATPEVANLQKALNENLRAMGKEELQLGRNVFQSKNFAEVSRQIVDAVDGDVQALRRLIPEIEATNLIMAAATGQFDDFNDKLIQITASSGSMQSGFEEAMKSITNQTQIATDEWKYFAFTISELTAKIKLWLIKRLADSLFALLQMFVLVREGFSRFMLAFVSGFAGAIDFVNQLRRGFLKLLDTVANLPSNLLKKIGLEGISDKIKIDIETEVNQSEFRKNIELIKNVYKDSIKGFEKKFEDLEMKRLFGVTEFAKFTEGQKQMEQQMSAFGKIFELPTLGRGKGVSGLTKQFVDVIDKMKTTLSSLGTKYKEIQEKGSDAITKLQAKTASNLTSINKNIKRVTQSMSDLRTEFDKQEGIDKKTLAEVFINAEEGVKKLKYELARATDAQQILDIKTQIREQEKALSDSAETRKEFATEIAEAQRRTGLTDIQRAVEDYATKRKLAEEEFSSKMSDLQAEKTALVEKRTLEIQMFNNKLQEIKRETLEKTKSLLVQKLALLTQQKEEIEILKNKEVTITELIKGAQSERQKVAITTFNETEALLNKEIQLYYELEAAIKRATAASFSSSFSNPNSPVLGSRATGGPIQQSGMYNLHQGEYILNRRESKGVGGIVVNINGGTYLSERVAEDIGDKIIDKLKTNVRL